MSDERLAGRFTERQRELLQTLVALASSRVDAERSTEQAYDEAGARAERGHADGRANADREAVETRSAIQREHDERLDQIVRTAQDQRATAERRQQVDHEHIQEKAAENEQRARKQLEEAIWASETVYEANERQPEERLKETEQRIDERRSALHELVRHAQQRVRRYRQKLPETAEVDAPAIATTKDAALMLEREQRNAEIELVRLQQLRLAGQFKGYGLHLIWVLVLGGAGAATAWLQGWQVNQWLFIALGGTLVVLAAITAMLFGAARRQVAATYGAFHAAASTALLAADKWWTLAEAERDAEELRMREQRDQEVSVARAKLEPIIERIAERRAHHLDRIEGKYPRLLEEIDEREARERVEVEQAYRQRREAVDRRHDEVREAVEEQYRTALEEREKVRDASWTALATAWRTGMDRCAKAVDAIQQENAKLFPAWDDPSWDTWSPPRIFAPSTRFGTLAVDRTAIAGGIPDDVRLRVDAPVTFELPATLDFPSSASLLLLTGAEGRATMVQTLQAVMLRLLTTLPPGKVRFTIIDPVGLGETFAGFMHLADYDEALVGGRIWTETRHIEQRLADLTEHMETIIQKYLRNEFETIDEYNEQAGEIAEPYRFLVISDFPANFSETAVRRLTSIASSGARCGVHLLAGVDMRLPRPKGLQLDDLGAHATVLEWTKEGHFSWRDEDFQQLPLTLDPPPPEGFMTRALHSVGEAAKDASRVEVPFGVIAPSAGEEWTRECSRSLRVPLGRSGATKLQELDIGIGTSQHALIAGKTGSGKSTLLHVLITNAALWYGPDEVQFFLVDFKKGVEFKTYAAHDLPHAQAIAIESDREFGLSVLDRIDREMKRRGDEYRARGVQDLAGYRATPDPEPMPRILLVIDEFQELFVEDDKIGQESSLLMDRLVRQGRAFGIHVLLGSQTLGGAYSLARSTMGQMQVRVALQCSEADSYLILSDDNAAARLLARPGEAIYNDAGGRLEGNSPFQICWLSDEHRDRELARVAELARERGWERSDPAIVFEGNIPAKLTGNHRLVEALDQGWPGTMLGWLGEAIAIKDPTATPLRRQSGSNVLIVGQRDEAALAMLASTIVGLAVQRPPGGDDDAARFVILDGSPADAPHAGYLEQLTAPFPHETTNVAWRDVEKTMQALSEELERRQTSDRVDAPPIVVIIFGLQRYRMLRNADDFSFSSSFDDADKPPAPEKLFATLLREGAPYGMHVICWCDTLANLNRTLSRESIGEFEMRVALQMSGADSTQLIDSPMASRLGLQRALFASEADGTLEKFRPYGVPELDWVRTIAARLRPGARDQAPTP